MSLSECVCVSVLVVIAVILVFSVGAEAVNHVVSSIPAALSALPK